VHAFTCLWYSVTGTKPVTVILIRDKSKTGYDIALVTTETWSWRRWPIWST
jgi:hypothetical protein